MSNVEPLKDSLPTLGPISNATIGNGTLHTAVVPVRPDGSFETGEFAVQAELAFGNLVTVLQDAGLTPADVAQVLVFLTDVADAPLVNEIWQRHFTHPYPNRATLVVAALAVDGLRIELTATACLDAKES